MKKLFLFICLLSVTAASFGQLDITKRKITADSLVVKGGNNRVYVNSDILQSTTVAGRYPGMRLTYMNGNSYYGFWAFDYLSGVRYRTYSGWNNYAQTYFSGMRCDSLNIDILNWKYRNYNKASLLETGFKLYHNYTTNPTTILFQVDTTGAAMVRGTLSVNTVANGAADDTVLTKSGHVIRWRSAAALSSLCWGLTGNASIDTTINFVGTTDAKALPFRTNNIERMRINRDGRIVVGNELSELGAGSNPYFIVNGSRIANTDLYYTGLYSLPSAWKTSGAAATSTIIGAQIEPQILAANNTSWSSTYGMTSLYLGHYIQAGATGTLTNSYDLYCNADIRGMTVTNHYGIYVANPYIVGPGAITNKYGIRVESGAGTNFLGEKTTISNNAVANGAALRLTSSATDNAIKVGMLTCQHYDVDAADQFILSGYSYNGGNDLYVGGGFGGNNATSNIYVYTAANGTTATGTVRAKYTSTGSYWFKGGTSGIVYTDSAARVGIGTNAPSSQLTVQATGKTGSTYPFRIFNSDGATASVLWVDDKGTIFMGLGATEYARIGTNANTNFYAGYQAGNALTTGTKNTFIGGSAGLKNTDAERNTFIGNYTGYENLSGTRNTFVGNIAGQNCTGNNNIFIGDAAGTNATAVGQNVCIGGSAGGNIAANYNVIMGHDAGGTASGAGYNTLIGAAVASGLTTGDNNTMIGYYAGASQLTESGNIFLGYYAGNTERGSNVLAIANTSDSSNYPISGIMAAAANKIMINGDPDSSQYTFNVNGGSWLKGTQETITDNASKDLFSVKLEADSVFTAEIPYSVVVTGDSAQAESGTWHIAMFANGDFTASNYSFISTNTQILQFGSLTGTFTITRTAASTFTVAVSYNTSIHSVSGHMNLRYNIAATGGNVHLTKL